MKAKPYRKKIGFASVLIIASIFFSVMLPSCDRKKGLTDDPLERLLCYSYARCPGLEGVRFIMIGDSWTDILFGFPLVRNLRTYVESDYGFRVAGATLAGRKLKTVLATGLHFETIRSAGPDATYVLISLGGNDLRFKSSAYNANPEQERQRVFGEIRENLKKLIRTGNDYKRNLFGGESLIWIVHGYDYTNPDNPYLDTQLESADFCRQNLLDKGFSSAILDQEFIKNLDLYNEMLFALTFEEPTMRYVDLRGTLGGPPVSLKSLMIDCIHPNDIGFAAIAARYVSAVDAITGGVR